MTYRYTALHDIEINCLVKNLDKAPKGIIVCAGTWRGGDLMAMISAQPNRYFIVVDSFKGLYTPNNKDYGEHGLAKEGMFNIKGKDNYIKNFKKQNIRLPDEIHEMWITEETIKTITTLPIALLWLDLDHYAPTKACLNHFGKNMVKNGIVLVHDYKLPVTPGVKKACDENHHSWIQQASGIYKGKNYA